METMVDFSEINTMPGKVNRRLVETIDITVWLFRLII